MIISPLIKKALLKAQNIKVMDIRAGLGYTGVVLEDGSCGLAYTFRNEIDGGCGVLGQAGKLIGSPAKELIPWAKSQNRLMSAIGLATINALFNNPAIPRAKGNVMTAFTLEQDETFGMVGEFPPILHRVQSMTDNIYVFEKQTLAGSEYYPSSAIPEYLPKCDVILITATTLINHTFDQVISSLGNPREVCLVGASTPLCPNLMREYQITLLAGSVVKDGPRAMEIISQGGGTMALKEVTEQVLVST